MQVMVGVLWYVCVSLSLKHFFSADKTPHSLSLRLVDFAHQICTCMISYDYTVSLVVLPKLPSLSSNADKFRTLDQAFFWTSVFNAEHQVKRCLHTVLVTRCWQTPFFATGHWVWVGQSTIVSKFPSSFNPWKLSVTFEVYDLLYLRRNTRVLFISIQANSCCHRSVVSGAARASEIVVY